MSITFDGVSCFLKREQSYAHMMPYSDHESVSGLPMIHACIGSYEIIIT